MHINYELKNGRKICIFLGYGLLDSEKFIGRVNGCYLDSNGQVEPFEDFECPLKRDNSNNYYFTLEEEDIYLNEYICLSVDELNLKLENEEIITQNDIAAAFIKDTSNIGFIVPMLKNNVFCELNDHFKEKSFYEVTLVPIMEEDKLIYSVKKITLESLAEKITSGEIKIVNKEEYRSRHYPQKIYK